MAAHGDQTREELVRAAGQLFARHGYRSATVREICREAGANVAAVQYHFGGKQGLYAEVLVSSHRELRDREPLPRLEQAPTPRAALRAWVGFALRLLLVRRRRHPFAGRLILRELSEPSAALTGLVRQVIQPVREELERVVGALLAEADEPERRARLTTFVLGLCVFHELGRPVLERLGHRPPARRAAVEALADEIAAFALAGIAAARRRAARGG